MNAPESASPPHVHGLPPSQLRALQAQAAGLGGYDLPFHDVLKDGSPGPELMVIPPGTFIIGATEAERDFGDLPQRTVTLERPYALGRFCVTASEFAAYTEATGFAWADHLIRTEGRQPVTNLDRDQAQAYLNWLSAETGQRYRLPSEAEWEYAARAGSTTPYCFGDTLGCGEGNTGSFRLEGRQAQGWRRFLPFCAPLNQAVDVGCYPANVWGLHDMHGNVWEYTSDTWVGALDAMNPAKQAQDGTWFVVKGGSWFEPARQARSAARKPRRINELDMNLGFRVLRELD
jgi:formylglycine-generating enzyme required for sulfatase activity